VKADVQSAPGMTAPETGQTQPRPSFDARYLAPLLITLVLAVGQWTTGFLESWSRTALAIGTAIVTELVLGRIVWSRWPHLASSYITGISVGMLLRSPWFWPYALGAAVSIVSKYALRLEGRHLWNPSNFGIVAMLVLASNGVAGLSIQWGNDLLPMVIVWCFGAAIVYRVGRFHITLTYVASFVAFAALRTALTGQAFLAELAPLTGPMYQLFIFFMITDPKTSVRSKRGQVVVAFLIALVETLMRLAQFVYAPFYALFLVGPAALLVERTLSHRAEAAKPAVV
jgi:Na+-translocating ferredoxin:NAD+ oxidoreductase RnfD subunit